MKFKFLRHETQEYSLYKEINTGKTWTDGKVVYRSTFNITPGKTIELNASIMSYVSITGFVILDGVFIQNLPLISGTGDIICSATIERNVLKLENSSGYDKRLNAFVSVEYTKSS